jgi:hypothetical protein
VLEEREKEGSKEKEDGGGRKKKEEEKGGGRRKESTYLFPSILPLILVLAFPKVGQLMVPVISFPFKELTSILNGKSSLPPW